jgi:hypothetical protein
MITGSDDVVSYELFLQEVRSDLNTGVSVEASTWNELKREFSFYDYSNEGFIDLDSAKMLVNHFSEHFTVNNGFYLIILKTFDINDLRKFVVCPQLNGLNLGYASRFKDSFDYVVFLNKIEYLNVASEYNKILENTRKVNTYMSAKLKTTQIETTTAPLMTSSAFKLKVLFLK